MREKLRAGKINRIRTEIERETERQREEREREREREGEFGQSKNTKLALLYRIGSFLVSF